MAWQSTNLTRDTAICTTTWSRTTFAINCGSTFLIWVVDLSLATPSNVELVRINLHDIPERLLMLEQATRHTEITG